MQINKINNYKQYLQFLDEFKGELRKRRAYEEQLTKQLANQEELMIHGFSWPIQQDSTFVLDHIYANQGDINFRERLVCNNSKLNNRTRACLHLFEAIYKPTPLDQIYLTEQCSQLASWVFKKYKKSIGSEYVHNCTWYYKTRLNLRLFPKKLNHQDLTNLSYKNEKFKYILSFDCLEHIPNYLEALKEIYRTLTIDGKLLLSAPFDINNPKNLS